jgi:hypothetical protein
MNLPAPAGQTIEVSYEDLLLPHVSTIFPEKATEDRGSRISGAARLFAGWCSHYNFRDGVGVKYSPMPRLQFTKRFVIVRNPDIRAPVVREFNILGTPNPKLVARKRDNLERFERVRLGQFSQLLNHLEPGSNPESTSQTPS